MKHIAGEIYIEVRIIRYLLIKETIVLIEVEKILFIIFNVNLIFSRFMEK